MSLGGEADPESNPRESHQWQLVRESQLQVRHLLHFCLLSVQACGGLCCEPSIAGASSIQAHPHNLLSQHRDPEHLKFRPGLKHKDVSGYFSH